MMKNKIINEDLISAKEKENLRTASQRRENYARTRDLLAEANNAAIVRRLVKHRQNQQKLKVISLKYYSEF